MTAVDRLVDYFVREARDHGLIDVKFFPTTDPSLTREECAEAMLAAMLSPQPVDATFYNEEF